MRLTLNKEGSGELQLKILKAICDKDNGLMGDIGCGFAPNTRQLGFKRKKFYDIVERDLGEENENFCKTEILELITDYFISDYDVLICLDCIEHFKKQDGISLIKWMGFHSRKQIFFTPLGDYIIETTPTNNPDSHKSGWMPEEFEKMGYATIVMPNYHPTLNAGAFFAFKCENIEQLFDKISKQFSDE